MLRACRSRLAIPASKAVVPSRTSLRNALPTFAQRRMVSTAADLAPRSRLSPLFTGLLFVGVGLTAYGIYDIYTLMSMWPEEIKEDLRAGVKAKLAGDYVLSSQYLQRAWQTVKTLPSDIFKSDPYMKISGVAIALADVYESQGDFQKAYEVYADALTLLQSAKAESKLNGTERLRAVGIAARLSTMAQQLQKPAQEEERWLTWGAEEVLRLVKEESIMDAPIEGPSDDTHVTLADLQLPDWVSVTDLGAPLEQLAGFYARNGKLDYAMPLYLQVISLLIPPPPKQSPPEDRCRGAQMMGHLSELIIRGGKAPPAERLQQAEAWARKSLSILQSTRRQAGHQIPMCEIAYTVALFNVAVMREMAGDKENAKEFVTRGIEHSKAIGMEDGIKIGTEALQRMGEVVEDQAPGSLPQAPAASS